MNPTIQWNDINHAIGWALLHFSWQGAAVALLLKAALGILRKSSAQVRYLVCCGALVLLALAPFSTCWFLVKVAPVTAPAPSPSLAFTTDTSSRTYLEPVEKSVVFRVRAPETIGLHQLRQWLELRMPWIVLGWSCGVVLMSVRLGIGAWLAYRFARSGIESPQPGWRDRAAGLCQTMGIRRSVRVVQSTLVQVPTTLGWIRPMVLLPVGCLTRFSTGQWEAIIAHELAHIRRHDYLVNLLQSALEAFLFYHPAVWWISSQIRLERENCCDDLAVRASGDPLSYAKALTELEVWRGSGSALALSATGGPLLTRIRRLLGEPPATRGASVWLMLLLVLLASSLGISVVLARSALNDRETGSQSQSTRPGLATTSQPVLRQTVASSQQDSSHTHGEKGSSVTKPLVTRTFRVDPATFVESIRRMLEHAPFALEAERVPLAPPSDIELIREFFLRAGLEFPASQAIGGGLSGSFPGAAVPEAQEVGKTDAVFFNDRTGILFVRTTGENMGIIEKAIQVATAAPPQVRIEVEFTEIPFEVLEASGLKAALATAQRASPSPVLLTNLTLAKQAFTNAEGAGTGERLNLKSSVENEKVSLATVGTLTRAQFKAMNRFFEQSAGSSVLAAPAVTTLSGRQAQIQMVELKNIVIDAVSSASGTVSTRAVPFGPSLDVIPYIDADGVSIRMTLLPQLTEFLGYDQPTPDQLAAAPPGTTVPLPRIRTRQTICHVTARDGETVVIADLGPAPAPERNGNSNPKRLVLFVTAVLIDAAGDRIHPE